MYPVESIPGIASYTQSERELLRAVRELVRADLGMRQAISRRMTVGETDLRAIRFVMASTRADRLTTPHELAEHLGITTAATTTMLDRLTAAGHVERVPHPTDGRSKMVWRPSTRMTRCAVNSPVRMTECALRRPTCPRRPGRTSSLPSKPSPRSWARTPTRPDRPIALPVVA